MYLRLSAQGLVGASVTMNQAISVHTINEAFQADQGVIWFVISIPNEGMVTLHINIPSPL